MSFGENLYLITQHQGVTLNECLASRRLEPRYTKVFFYQLCHQLMTLKINPQRGLKYLHSAKIVHCDLKPYSILITRGCDLQITGLDHSRIHGERVMMDYAYGNTDQCYQAPEIMLGAQAYQPAIDMWAAGCILAEMINGAPLFSEERCTNQLYAIIRLLGYVPGDLMDGLSSGDIVRHLKSLPARDWRTLKIHISTTEDDALDLLERLFDFDPEIRCSASQALEHAYVSLYHDPADEPTSERTWSVADLEYVEWPVNDWKTLMYVTHTHQPSSLSSYPRWPPPPLPSGHFEITPPRCLIWGFYLFKTADC
ncbi:CMGC/MAPK/P38 protein kinase [Emergomyces pasteurianus Ep9510]|uniref:CMGC/MAPK/P38 protein kinase n=1 Tax=Emergomyces pasteurianus Ep9510 TaxID=1447872 RepID=A0A1J9PG12_9EURO|nr:CMGC/MAPK/P38 protein kinase [Emergomyces pasteurianus Ep9510]